MTLFSKLFLYTSLFASAGLALADSETTGTNWVVIAAGSKGYENYRHQADACHAYQIALKNGVPAEQIILMMADDVAGSSQNPFPGQLFNKPTKAGVPGVDVYDGCVADYTGTEPSAKLFLDVLQGKGPGKVLKSGPNDKVFINFVDHGGAQIVEFPNGPFLQAKDLNAALQQMSDNEMFDKLVFYMEACEGGSMFDNLLPQDINVFATTAANPTESSWGTYCPPQDMVNGKSINSCLGDLYSVNWMQDADTKIGLARTLDGEFDFVRNETAVKSHVQEYGTIGTFSSTDHVKDYLGGEGQVEQEQVEQEDDFEKIPVDARDIPLLTSFYNYLRSQDGSLNRKALAKELINVVKHRENADARYTRIISALQATQSGARLGDNSIKNSMDCRMGVYHSIEKHCGKRMDSYERKFSSTLLDFCKTRSWKVIDQAVRMECGM